MLMERKGTEAAYMMEQTSGAHGLSKLHLDKVLDKGLRMSAEETHL